MHGIRLGINYIYNTETESGQDYMSQIHLKKPTQFVIGYEMMQRVVGQEWVNFIFAENIMIAGLEQSSISPVLNFLSGFEIYNRLQLAVGINITFIRESWSHMIFALGWTPQVGTIFIPVHFYFVPDVENRHRMGLTVGLNF